MARTTKKKRGTRSKGPRTITVDWAKAESGGGRLKVPEGDYLARSKTAQHKTSEASGNPMVVVQFVGKDGKLKGKEFRDYFPLTDNMLWKLRQFMEAAGIDVPSKKSKLVLADLEGVDVGVTIGDDEDQNGRPVSRPQDYIEPDEVGAEKDEASSDDYEGLSRKKLEKLATKRKVKFKSTDSDGKLVKRLRKADEDVDEVDLDEEM